MPNKMKHRGKHPKDEILFSPNAYSELKNAVDDLCWLLTKHYSEKAALKLVGDRYKLTARQRKAVLGASCSEEEQTNRIKKQMHNLTGQDCIIDGFNLLITIESILGNAILIRGKDGVIRDIASIHGSYRTVEETEQTIELMINTLLHLKPKTVHFVFDSPVSNSGKLKQVLLARFRSSALDWQVTLKNNPDREIVESGKVAISSDSWILNNAAHWFPFGDSLIQHNHLNPEILVFNK